MQIEHYKMCLACCYDVVVVVIVMLCTLFSYCFDVIQDASLPRTPQPLATFPSGESRTVLIKIVCFCTGGTQALFF